MVDHRSLRERWIDNADDREQAQRWKQAQLIVPYATVTQVSKLGFFYRERRQPIAVFRPWPRSEEAIEGSQFGRVAPPRRKDKHGQ